MIYDITQPLFGCKVYPGDDAPKKMQVTSILNGDLYNLTNISLCVHNGTHVDAPLHFYQDQKGIGEVALEKFIGPCYVYSFDGDILEQDAHDIIQKAKNTYPSSQKRILIKGSGVVTLEASKVFNNYQIDLIASEQQTVGPEDAPMAVHLELLGHEVVLLEGIVLKDIQDGAYFLNCAPLNLGHLDGAPCRAILMDL